MQFLGRSILTRQIDRSGRTAWVVGEAGIVALGLVTWAIWFACVAIRISTKTQMIAASGLPAGALIEYFDYIHRFWAGAPLYITADLHGFHYLPIMLILGTPLTWASLPVAAAALGVISAGFLTWSVYRLARSLDPVHAVAPAGAILALSAMAAIVSLTLLQLQMPMTAAMIAGTAAGMQGRWREMALWLALAIAIKPLAIVLALLCAAAIPRTRLILAGATALLLAAPFAFRDWAYLSSEYANYVRQLWHITSAAPGNWIFQADISTLLSHLGLDLNSGPRLAIRLGAALGTLILALRIAALGNARATAFSLFILAACYIGLFNPRQEHVSFLVVVPAVAALAIVILARNILDWRGWVSVALALLVGAQWGPPGRWLLPAFMVAIWINLLCLVWNRNRWIELLLPASEAFSTSSSEPP